MNFKFLLGRKKESTKVSHDYFTVKLLLNGYGFPFRVTLFHPSSTLHAWIRSTFEFFQSNLQTKNSLFYVKSLVKLLWKYFWLITTITYYHFIEELLEKLIALVEITKKCWLSWTHTVWTMNIFSHFLNLFHRKITSNSARITWTLFDSQPLEKY